VTWRGENASESVGADEEKSFEWLRVWISAWLNILLNSRVSISVEISYTCYPKVHLASHNELHEDEFKLFSAVSATSGRFQ
jgi:hypothetical protein